jgi:hypothetical protein
LALYQRFLNSGKAFLAHRRGLLQCRIDQPSGEIAQVGHGVARASIRLVSEGDAMTWGDAVPELQLTSLSVQAAGSYRPRRIHAIIYRVKRWVSHVLVG